MTNTDRASDSKSHKQRDGAWSVWKGVSVFVSHAGVFITSLTNLDGEGEVVFLVLIQKVSGQDNLLAGLAVLSGGGDGPYITRRATLPLHKTLLLLLLLPLLLLLFLILLKEEKYLPKKHYFLLLLLLLQLLLLRLSNTLTPSVGSL